MVIVWTIRVQISIISCIDSCTQSKIEMSSLWHIFGADWQEDEAFIQTRLSSRQWNGLLHHHNQIVQWVSVSIPIQNWPIHPATLVWLWCYQTKSINQSMAIKVLDVDFNWIPSFRLQFHSSWGEFGVSTLILQISCFYLHDNASISKTNR